MAIHVNNRLQWLEVMRGIAACWVLLHHADQSISYFIGSGGGLVGSPMLANGQLGVDFFFVLSGFIIASSSNRLIEVGGGIGDFARARLIRIYVPYLPVGIAMVALYVCLPELSAGARSPGILTSLTLLPSTSPPALSVAWTLVHELIFYALFSLIFVSRPLLWTVMACWAGAILFGYFTAAEASRPLLYFLSPLNLCFLLGVGTYYLTKRGISGMTGWLGAGLGVVVLALEAGQAEPNRVLLALGFAGLIVAACSSWAQGFNPGRIALTLGAASYSIYLIHNPVLSIAVRGLVFSGLTVKPSVALLAISAVALAVGLLYYWFFERAALKLAKKLLMPSRRMDSRQGSSVTISPISDSRIEAT